MVQNKIWKISKKVERRETQFLFLQHEITKEHALKNGPAKVSSRSCRPTAQSDMHRFSQSDMSIRLFDGIEFQAPIIQ